MYDYTEEDIKNGEEACEKCHHSCVCEKWLKSTTGSTAIEKSIYGFYAAKGKGCPDYENTMDFDW